MERVLKFFEWKQKKKEKLQNEFLIKKINEISEKLIKENSEKASWVIIGNRKFWI
jgi:hypothetical protein